MKDFISQAKEFTDINSTFPQLLSKGVGLRPEGSSRISRTRRKGPRSSHGAQDRCERKFFSPPSPLPVCQTPHFQGPAVPQRPRSNGCQRFFRGRSSTTVKVPFLYQRVLTAHSPAYLGVPGKTTDNQRPKPHEGAAPPPPPNTAQKGPRTGQSRTGGQTARWTAATP